MGVIRRRIEARQIRTACRTCPAVVEPGSRSRLRIGVRVDGRVVVGRAEQQLRLLDQAVYKYGAGDGGLLEGGLFAFVVGTDPEVLLVIEAREREEGRRWHYALARMNRDAMRVRHKDQEVW